MTSIIPRKVLFLTGTRADFGKVKPLIQALNTDESFDVRIFVTGMHMLSKYGSTWEEVRKSNLGAIYKFINQNNSDSMDLILAKTISGLSDYVKETLPDLIVVHGDRVEAMAGAVVGALNNILVAHVEGGEVSGTIDELMRHAISKMAHLHFVSNEEARKRLIQLGESDSAIHVVGSPDIDVMNSPNLPSLEEVLRYYDITFNDYAILLFHPVTTEYKELKEQIAQIVDIILDSKQNFVVLYPNNDFGSDIILEEYSRLRKCKRIAIFPSMRFEYFLTLLKFSNYIIGNSSTGIREAPHYGVPAINIGTRQHKRVKTTSVVDVPPRRQDVLKAIKVASMSRHAPAPLFGYGGSANAFYQVLADPSTWAIGVQKYFVDKP